ncbi:hypothetical protein RGQ29_028066 [Quercus rubra]|uniref:Uncharacterized protein n=1 Tax=Quercus rubra TaxID=3512 RepID=A0AAN7ER62_QUERU|nr:hypothetical protein RGQ29_028066 [Quercus rubra]
MLVYKTEDQDSNARICWWSYGLQLEEFRTIEVCNPMSFWSKNL